MKYKKIILIIICILILSQLIYSKKIRKYNKIKCDAQFDDWKKIKNVYNSKDFYNNFPEILKYIDKESHYNLYTVFDDINIYIYIDNIKLNMDSKSDKENEIENILFFKFLLNNSKSIIYKLFINEKKCYYSFSDNLVNYLDFLKCNPDIADTNMFFDIPEENNKLINDINIQYKNNKLEISLPLKSMNTNKINKVEYLGHDFIAVLETKLYLQDKR